MSLERVYGRFSTGPSISKPGRPAYAVEDLPGKGKGVIARRRIVKGEVFMVDYPALLVETGMMSELTPGMRKGVVKLAFENLPRETRAKVLDLAKSTGGDEVLDAFTTNSCNVFMADGEAHLGLFPEVSVSLLLFLYCEAASTRK